MASSHFLIVLILCVTSSFLSLTNASDLSNNNNNIISYDEQHSVKSSSKTPVNPSATCDADHRCAIGQTCCCIYKYSNICFSYGCCPFESATCCDDNFSCCPQEFPVCNIAAGTCTISSNSPLGVKAMPRTLAKPIVRYG